MTKPADLTDAQLNERLALASGWSHIKGALWIDSPFSSVGRTLPNFTGDWRHCGPLQAKLRGSDSDAALRRAICEAALIVLEGESDA